MATLFHLKFDSKIPLNQAHQLDDGMRFLCDSNRDVVGAVFPDVLFELQFVEDLFCLSVCTEVEESQKQVPHKLSGNYSGQARETVMGLALLQENGPTNVFKRVGMFRWVKKSMYKDAKVSEVVLL